MDAVHMDDYMEFYIELNIITILQMQHMWTIIWNFIQTKYNHDIIDAVHMDDYMEFYIDEI